MELPDRERTISKNSFNMNKRCHSGYNDFPTLRMDDYSISSPRKKPKFINTDDQDFFGNLPNDCVFNIFRFLPSAKDRCSCAAVSKEWLILQTYMQSSEFKSTGKSIDNTITAHSQIHDSSCNQISRCLQGKHANDARLAAIMVGICGEEELSELCIRGGLQYSKGITDVGLSVVARTCPNLKSLSIWDCSGISSKGIDFIAKGCKSLEKLDLINLPHIDESGLTAIAENCPSLSILHLESLPLIGNASLNAFAKFSSQLETFSLEKCPLVGDQGIMTIISNLPKLCKLKIISMDIGDSVLEAIGHHGISLKSLSLEQVSGVTESGFSSLQFNQNLRFLSLRSCSGLSDTSFKAIGESLVALRQVLIQNCDTLTDVGLKELTKSTSLLETLKLVECNDFTISGLSEVLMNRCKSLKSLSLIKCQGLDIESIDNACQQDGLKYPSLHSLIIKKCQGIEDSILSWIGKACQQVKHVSLIGQTSITDRGVIALLKALKREPKSLTDVDFRGCSQLTDASVVTLTSLFGEKIHKLMLGGCGNISDFSLKMVSELCPCLVDLDLSKCGITDYGMFCLATSQRPQLQVLSLSGCDKITDCSLRYLLMMPGRLMGLNLKSCSGLSQDDIDSLRSTIWWCDLLY